MVFLSIKSEKALNKLTRTVEAVAKQGESTSEQLAEVGKWYAKSIVPVYTGKTFDYIVHRRLKQGKETRHKVIAKNPTLSDGHSRNVANFNLVRWMHTSGRARRHIHSGDPKFMYTTRDYLNRIKKGVAKGKYKSINIK